MSIKTKSIFKVNNKLYLLCTTEINKSILDSIQSKWFNVITVISFSILHSTICLSYAMLCSLKLVKINIVMQRMCHLHSFIFLY